MAMLVRRLDVDAPMCGIKAMKGLLRASTIVEVKFLEAIASMPWLCQCFSCLIKSWISMSTASRWVKLQAVMESMVGVRGDDGNSDRVVEEEKAIAPPRGGGIARDHPWCRVAQ